MRLFVSWLRRLLRRVMPRRPIPYLDDPITDLDRDVLFREAYLGNIEGSFLAADELYVRARYREAQRLRNVVTHFLGSSNRVLDVGGGNGAIELCLAAAGFGVFSIDQLWSDVGRRSHLAAGVPFHRVVAEAASMPFRDNSFDAIMAIDTLEHLRAPKRIGEEIVRILAPQGYLFLTTPSRWRYLARPDPHFGIRGLLLLPPKLQRLVARRRGFGDLYHVERTYSSVPQIRALFPSTEVVRIVSGSRAPRRWFWDLIVLQKG